VKPPEWIVSDLDETLLRSDNTISDYTLTVLKRVRASGSKFAIATTRYKSFAQKYIDILQPDAMVVSGGAIGIINDEIVHYQVMGHEKIEHLLDDLNSLPTKRPTVIDSSDGRYGDNRPVPRPFEHEANQMIIWLTKPLSQSFIGKWSEHFLITTLWIPGLYRIADFKASKLEGLKTVLNSVDTSGVYTFGDDPMDAGMLGYYQGVAVANAHKEAREAARYHTLSNDEDGVARWLESNFLM